MKNWVRRDSQRRRQDVLLLDTRCGRKIQLCLFQDSWNLNFLCPASLFLLAPHDCFSILFLVSAVADAFPEREDARGFHCVSQFQGKTKRWGTWGCRDMGL